MTPSLVIVTHHKSICLLNIILPKVKPECAREELAVVADYFCTCNRIAVKEQSFAGCIQMLSCIIPTVERTAVDYSEIDSWGEGMKDKTNQVNVTRREPKDGRILAFLIGGNWTSISSISESDDRSSVAGSNYLLVNLFTVYYSPKNSLYACSSYICITPGRMISKVTSTSLQIKIRALREKFRG
jgi:hypothetical protein